MSVASACSRTLRDDLHGSNVVGAVVRALRRRVGEDAALDETARAWGYRYASP